MLYQIFLSRQMKWCAIISYKHGIYKLSHELPNDLEFVSNILWMVVGYRLHIYVGYYFELWSSNACICHSNETYEQSLEETKNNGAH